MAQVQDTKGQAEKTIGAHDRDEKQVKQIERELAAQRSKEVTVPANGELTWSTYSEIPQ